MTDISDALTRSLSPQCDDERHVKKQRRASIATAPSPPKTPPLGPQQPDAVPRLISQGAFEPDQHFYPRVLNAQIHPLVQAFFSLDNDRIIARYTHLNPKVKPECLRKLLSYQPTHFHWAGKLKPNPSLGISNSFIFIGSDLFSVTTASGQRQMIVIETNSCPSGQKSMPLLSETNEQGGYRLVIESAFREQLSKADKGVGGLAVIYDKNVMESSGYAAVLADVAQEDVWLVEWNTHDPDPNVKWLDGILYVRSTDDDQEEEWHPIRACFRYLTQKPWNRFPLCTKTIVMNEIISCLAGGRNKMMAARAYDFYNAELRGTGLAIRTPETINNVTMGEISLYINSMGGHAVLKVPYSNAGKKQSKHNTPSSLSLSLSLSKVKAYIQSPTRVNWTTFSNRIITMTR